MVRPKVFFMKFSGICKLIIKTSDPVRSEMGDVGSILNIFERWPVCIFWILKTQHNSM